MKHILPCVALWLVACGAIALKDIEDKDALAVSLDSNAKTVIPRMPVPLKFFIDVTNQRSQSVDLAGFKVELKVFDEREPDQVRLRQTWTYRSGTRIYLPPGKKFSIPVVPERGKAAELPLELLPAGTYGVVAVVSDRFTSPPYRLRIERPDLNRTVRR